AAAGGGTVRFGPGTYLSYSIRLKSNVALYIDHGATVLAADSPPQGAVGGYDAPEPNEWGDKYQYQDFGHSHWHNSLFWGEGIHDVAILGPGLIDGKGLTRGGNPRPGLGNKAISLKLCRNVIIRDVSILRGGHFAILATGVDNLTIDNLKIDTNRDGIDIDCCRQVRVSNCSVNSPADDGNCLKSSFGLGFARATENVTITNCQVSGYEVGSFLDGTYKRSERRAPDGAGPTGRIKFGTESNGEFKNITISNCVFDYCRGLALESVDGGLLEDVAISNITMRDIVNSPIFLRLGSRMRGPEGTPVGTLRRVSITDVVVYNADPRYGSIISGIPGHEIEDVWLSNIRILYAGGGTKEQAALEPPEKEKDYPEPRMFGDMPAYGFFVRHVRGLELRNVEVGVIKDDPRPAFLFQDVKRVDLQHIRAHRGPDSPAVVLKNVSEFSAHQCWPIGDVKLDRVDLKTL
ncbi:MAG TPA: right-handed parallel beta-helix repeat-containing protein, partial [Blastocatellia bacterium]|nr:right-handed parallel beta-helix repeat-containing protein [Blastocatellia bacterium]